MKQKVKIMPCLDMQNGRVVKGVQFVEIRDAGDPVETCRAYCQAGADALTMLDISATLEGRDTLLKVVADVAQTVTVPFTVGGGIHDIPSAAIVLEAGANNVSVNSAAFKNPALIGEMIKEFGTDRVTVAIDVAQNKAMPSGYEVYVKGGTVATGVDAIEWAKQVDAYGVTTILPTSKSTDGMRTGFDLPLISKMKAATRADIVASGGAGTMEHFLEAARAGATILLGASVFHFNVISIPELKAYLAAHEVTVS